MDLKISLTCLFIAIAINFVSSLLEDHHREAPSRSHRLVYWPGWSRDRLLHARHDRTNDDYIVRETSTVRNSWTARPHVPATRLPQQVNSASRNRMEQRTPERNPSGAIAMTEYGGTRATAYVGYHGNHRHQQREVVTQSYQLIPTTVPTYTRHHPGRRVCTRQAPVTSHHHRGRQIRLVYTELTSGFFCCPGWSQVTHLSFGCNKPICLAPCLNAGICTSSGKCTCPKGYTGNQCQTDVDECVTEKPCGQLCTNLPGSYRCHCRSGFQLQKDDQSCRRNDSDENAFEARDLEGDFHDVLITKDPTSHDTENEVGDDGQNFEIILKRLTKLEKQVARNKKRDIEASEMDTKVTLAVESINQMKRTVENAQLMQQEVYDMRNKMKQYETELRKLQHLINRVTELESRLRIRCRSTIPINSGSLNF